VQLYLWLYWLYRLYWLYLKVNVQYLVDGLHPDQVFEVLRALPLGELGPVASFFKDKCIEVVASNVADTKFYSDTEFETLAPQLLVQILRRVQVHYAKIYSGD
jgi:hypothetical protein